MDEHLLYLQNVADTCLRCRSCRCFHSASVVGSYCYGELASLLLSGQTSELPASVFGCHQCGLCLKKCPRKFNAKEFMFHARAVLEAEDRTRCRIYDGVRVDLPENVFAKLRREQGFSYDDVLLREGGSCARLFVPGCHMSHSFPGLTREVEELLEAHDIADGLTAVCCGNPLYAAGFFEEFEAYAQKMAALYAAHGVRQIITPCPSCYDFDLRLIDRGYLQGVEVKTLSEALVEAGAAIDPAVLPEGVSVAIHDSCPDRMRGVFGPSVRELYRNCAVSELAHVGKDTLCCGCGGLVPPYSADIAAEGKRLKARDFEATGADHLVTTCFNCRKGLADTVPVCQYLEDLVKGCTWEEETK